MKHIGILAHSFEGAALCYRTMCLEGVARLGATRAGLYLFVEPLATVALAVPVLDEPFGPVAMAGGALVLAGVFVAQRKRRT